MKRESICLGGLMKSLVVWGGGGIDRVSVSAEGNRQATLMKFILISVHGCLGIGNGKYNPH